MIIPLGCRTRIMRFPLTRMMIGLVFVVISTLVGDLAIIVEVGLLLAAALVFSRHLWLPIGIHLAWNFTQTGIFGVDGAPGLFQGIFITSSWLMGDDYGSVISMVSAALCSLVGVYFLVSASRRGQLIRPYWGRATHRQCDR